MLAFFSFFQSVCSVVKSSACYIVQKISKNMYRSFAVLSIGLVAVLVLSFTLRGFGGGGKNVISVFAETSQELEPLVEEEEEETEETVTVTKAKIQYDLDTLMKSGQLLVGDYLVRDMQQKKEIQLVAKENLERKREAIRIKKEEAARKAKEEADQKAREEALRNTEAVSQAPAEVSYTDSNYQVLLRIVEAEAGICDEKGKILVANVILNRVLSDDFPDNITDVVYETEQFSPVSNGTIDTCEVSEQTVECVNRALAGEDYSEGALYFMNRGGARSYAVSWFDSRLTFLFQHERHEFFK